MTTKIFILSWFSYTESDNYLYSDIKTFTDEEKAMAEFESDCEKAYDECKWGSQWDEPEDERDEDCAYDVDESRDPGTYQVSSGAYDGYHVEVSIEEKEIEIPATDKNSKGEDVPAIIYKGYDLRAVNSDFQNLLAKHQHDTEVTGASREQFEKAKQDNAEWAEKDPEDYADSVNTYAMAYNAWDEICSRYEDIRESGLDWFCGACYAGFDNEWDLYIGTGNEH